MYFLRTPAHSLDRSNMCSLNARKPLKDPTWKDQSYQGSILWETSWELSSAGRYTCSTAFTMFYEMLNANKYGLKQNISLDNNMLWILEIITYIFWLLNFTTLESYWKCLHHMRLKETMSNTKMHSGMALSGMLWTHGVGGTRAKLEQELSRSSNFFWYKLFLKCVNTKIISNVNFCTV